MGLADLRALATPAQHSLEPGDPGNLVHEEPLSWCQKGSHLNSKGHGCANWEEISPKFQPLSLPPFYYQLETVTGFAGTGDL